MRPSARRAWPAVIPSGSASMRSCSAAYPCGSRQAAIAGTIRFDALRTIQPSAGRMTSAQTSMSRPVWKLSRLCGAADRPVACRHRIGRSSHCSLGRSSAPDGLPPLLPAVAGEAGQPFQHPRGSVTAVAVPLAGRNGGASILAMICPGAEQARRPAAFIRAPGERRAAGRRARSRQRGLGEPGRALVGPHLHGRLPNSTSSDRGSYPGAGGAGSFPARACRAWCARSAATASSTEGFR